METRLTRLTRLMIRSSLVVACAIPPAVLAQAVEPWPTHGWAHSTPEAQGMDSNVLADAFDYIREHHIPIHSLQVVRNGYLVVDAYFWPFQDNQVHDLASVTKSVTSTLAGIAIGQHKLTGVNEPVLAALGKPSVANASAQKDAITVEHLLTMTSGLDCHFDHGEITLSQMMASRDWVRFMLDLPMAAAPGSHYEYCSPGMHLLSAVVARATGASTLDFARRALFAPLGIDSVAWPADPQGVPFGWGDLHLQPRDMAKLGYLWLKRGRWENRQVVPSGWMDAAVQVHSHPGFSVGQEYGYGMWIYPKRTPQVFEGLGRGGQRISFVPATNLVVVFTGSGFEPGDVGDFIGRAITSTTPLPESKAASSRLAAAVSNATRAPAARAVPAPPSIARTVSGRTYSLDANPLGIKSLTLTFAGGAEATVRLEMSDRVDGPRAVGMDGVPRVSSRGRFGLPVAVSGTWDGDSTFVLDYDEVGNIDDYRLRLTFAGSVVNVELTERTGLMNTKFSGKARG